MNYYYVIQSEAFRIFLRFFVASLLGMTDKVFLCDASLSSEPVIASKARFTAYGEVLWFHSTAITTREPIPRY